MRVERQHKERPLTGVRLICPQCYGVFYVKASRAKTAKTCSKVCKDEMATGAIAL